MKATLLFLVLFLSINMFSQKRMVLIEGFQEHEIEVSDSLTEATVEEFYWWVYKHRIDYETKLQKLIAVRTVPMSKNRMHYFDRGVIYINSYADSFPYSKRIIILHELGLFYGAKPTKGSSLDVMNENFYLTPFYESRYVNRKTHFTDMKMLMKILEKTSPLKTK